MSFNHANICPHFFEEVLWYINAFNINKVSILHSINFPFTVLYLLKEVSDFIFILLFYLLQKNPLFTCCTETGNLDITWHAKMEAEFTFATYYGLEVNK